MAIDGRLSNLRINGSVSGSIHTTNISPDGIQPITFSANNNTNDKTNNDSSRQQSGEEELATVKEKHPEYFVHTGDARVSPIWYKGKLWFALNVGCFVNDDIQSRSCIRIIEFDTNSSKVELDFNIGHIGEIAHFSSSSNCRLYYFDFHDDISIAIHFDD